MFVMLLEYHAVGLAVLCIQQPTGVHRHVTWYACTSRCCCVALPMEFNNMICEKLAVHVVQ